MPTVLLAVKKTEVVRDRVLLWVPCHNRFYCVEFQKSLIFVTTLVGEMGPFYVPDVANSWHSHQYR